MIYQVHSAVRGTAPEYEYTAPVHCLNCDDTYDADDHSHLLTEIAYDANGQMQYVCDECLPSFTCELCHDHRIDLLRICDDLLCPPCVATMLESEVA
jgi:hypothetical protein